MEKKKKIIIGVSIIVLIILIIKIFIITMNYKDINDYNNRKTTQLTIQANSLNQEFKENNSIELGDLLIKLNKVEYSNNSNDNNSIKFGIEIDNKEGKNLNSVLFDYIIFDDENNIINSSLWGNLKINKGYIRGFVNEKYNQKQYQELNNHCIYRQQNFEGDITDNTKTVKRILSSSLDKELNSPKQINIRLLNLKYKTDDTELETFSDNEIEFVLKFQ